MRNAGWPGQKTPEPGPGLLTTCQVSAKGPQAGAALQAGVAPSPARCKRATAMLPALTPLPTLTSSGQALCRPREKKQLHRGRGGVGGGTATHTRLPTSSLLDKRFVASLVFLKAWRLPLQRVGGQLWTRRQVTCSQLLVCVTLGKSLLSRPWVVAAARSG